MSVKVKAARLKAAGLQIVGAAVFLGTTAFLSRILGLIRDRLFAGTFGAGPELDAYYAAFRIPDLVYTFLILGALSAGFIPYFTERYSKKKADAWRFTNAILNIMGVLLVGMSVIGVFFTPWIIRVVAPGFDDQTVALTIPVSRLLYISTALLGLSSVFGGVLQGVKRFTLYAIAPLLYNVGIIAGTIWAQQVDGSIFLVGIGVVGGALLHLLIQMWGSFHSGWRYKLIFDWRSKDVREMFALMGPRVIGLALSQVNLIAMTAIASLLASGSVAIFNFANNIQYVPIGMFGISFAIAAFPSLSESANRKDLKGMIATVSETTRNILYLIIPMSVVFLLLRAQIVRVVLGADGFGWNETVITANTLAFFVLSLFAQALVPLYVRIFFAMKNTLIPALVALLTALVNIVCAYWWSHSLGVVGIAAAFSTASILQLVLLWFLAFKKLGGIDLDRQMRTLLEVSSASVIAGLMIVSVKQVIGETYVINTFFGVLLQGALSGGAGLLVYVVLTWVLKSPEFTMFSRSFHARLFRKSTLLESGDEAIETQA